ncbi:MAG TPA: C40 family peptidase [Rhodanobacteraceae bacterium]|nr:C40 family peptidase [Rhodanobacteraceae bacterium]
MYLRAIAAGVSAESMHAHAGLIFVFPPADAVQRLACRARRHLRLVAAAALLLLGACSTLPVPPVATPTPAPAPTAAVANNVLIRAIGLVGTPYRWGGNTPASGFDCSGLVAYVFRTQAGIALPRTSREMGALDAPRIARDDLRSGDLVFFGRHGRVTHVGIYVGNGRFVNAPDTGGTVQLDRLDGYYWRDHYLFAKRVLTPDVRSELASRR